MADKPASKASKSSGKPTGDEATVNATNSTNPQRKRRVLRPAAEPTTLREQSEQAKAKSAKPRRGSHVAGTLAKPFRLVGRQLARLFRPLGKFRVVRAIGYVLAPPYVRNSWKELKQVTWPDRSQTRRLTFAVILFSLVFGGIVAGVDYGLDKLFRTFILNQ